MVARGVMNVATKWKQQVAVFYNEHVGFLLCESQVQMCAAQSVVLCRDNDHKAAAVLDLSGTRKETERSL